MYSLTTSCLHTDAVQITFRNSDRAVESCMDFISDRRRESALLKSIADTDLVDGFDTLVWRNLAQIDAHPV